MEFTLIKALPFNNSLISQICFIGYSGYIEQKCSLILPEESGERNRLCLEKPNDQ